MHGWIVLDKPVGLGSTQGVAAVKRVLRESGHGRRKVGHGGTLDPLASGVLPIAVGEATKLAGRMLDGDKAYAFTIRFGVETDTLDAEGAAIATSDVRPTGMAVAAVLRQFTGPIDQVPPAYSALKMDGKRAYALARSGEVVTLATRRVTIHALHVVPDPSTRPVTNGSATCDSVTLSAHVSKGTYIRSLARDIALALGTVGHVTMLRRTRAGPFGLAQAISLDRLNEIGQRGGFEDILLPMRAGLDDIPALALTPDQAGALRQGRVLDGVRAADGAAFAMLDDTPVALVDISDGCVSVARGFNL